MNKIFYIIGLILSIIVSIIGWILLFDIFSISINEGTKGEGLSGIGFFLIAIFAFFYYVGSCFTIFYPSHIRSVIDLDYGFKEYHNLKDQEYKVEYSHRGKYSLCHKSEYSWSKFFIDVIMIAFPFSKMFLIGYGTDITYTVPVTIKNDNENPYLLLSESERIRLLNLKMKNDY